MDLSNIPLDTWLGQGIFCLLFVWLLFDTRKEAKQREDKLSAQIDRQNAAQEKIASSLQRVETQINELKEGK
ncbi:BhlA/UviB family holin-like peptide [Heyndrickxia sporothermodurans]